MHIQIDIEAPALLCHATRLLEGKIPSATVISPTVNEKNNGASTDFLIATLDTLSRLGKFTSPDFMLGQVIIVEEHVKIVADANMSTARQPTEYGEVIEQASRCLRQVFDYTANTRIGLVSNGEEAGKGSSFTQELFESIKHNDNFLGNIEPQDIFTKNVEVILADSFTAGVILNTIRSAVPFLANLLQNNTVTMLDHIGTRIAASAFADIQLMPDSRFMPYAIVLDATIPVFVVEKTPCSLEQAIDTIIRMT